MILIQSLCGNERIGTRFEALLYIFGIFLFVNISFHPSCSVSVPASPLPSFTSHRSFLCLYSVTVLQLVNMTLFKVLWAGWRCTEEINLAACESTCPSILIFTPKHSRRPQWGSGMCQSLLNGRDVEGLLNSMSFEVWRADIVYRNKCGHKCTGLAV